MMQPMRPRVVTGDSPDVFEHLRDPYILSVVWTGCWSEAALALAGKMTASRTINRLSAERQYLGYSNIADKTGGVSFKEDHLRIAQTLARWGLKLMSGRASPAKFDLTLEPAIPAGASLSTGKWHPDFAVLRALSVPGGLTTEYLDDIPDGEFLASGVFQPADPDAVEASARPLPNNAVMAFKASRHPHTRGKGLIHRRPNAKLMLQSPMRGRLIAQMAL